LFYDEHWSVSFFNIFFLYIFNIIIFMVKLFLFLFQFFHFLSGFRVTAVICFWFWIHVYNTQETFLLSFFLLLQKCWTNNRTPNLFLKINYLIFYIKSLFGILEIWKIFQANLSLRFFLYFFWIYRIIIVNGIFLNKFLYILIIHFWSRSL
jgi:hypothetical protein